MKKILIFILVLLILVGCQTAQTKESTVNKQPQVTIDGNKTLIVYFTRADNIQLTTDADTSTSASLVIKDNEIVGNTGYVARVIQEEIGGTLIPITVSEKYTSDYDELVTKAKQDGQDQVRPNVDTVIVNLDDYDTVILGYPNWWYDMPMAVYTFLENYDLSDKTIIPFVTHGGSRFSNTIENLRSIIPQATIVEGLAVYQHDVIEKEEDIRTWARGLK